MNESNCKKIEVVNENTKLIEQNAFLEKENGNLKESISIFNKGKEILDGMISMNSTPSKLKGVIGFKSANASSSKGVRPSIPITKDFHKSSFNSNGPKKSIGNKTHYSRANILRGPKPRKHYHAHSHGFHSFKMKEHAYNIIYHYCGVMGHKNTKCYIRKTHLGYSNDESFNANPQGPKYIWVPKVR